MALKFWTTTLIGLCLCSQLLFAEGKLVIHSSIPYARVYLDGTYVATTNASGDFRIDQLPDGRFLIVLEKPGFQSSEHSVVIHSKAITSLRVEMQGLERPAAPARAGPANAARETPRREEPRRVERPLEEPASKAVTPAPPSVTPQAAPTEAQESGHGFLYVTLIVVGLGLLTGGIFYLKHHVPMRMRVKAPISEPFTDIEPPPEFDAMTTTVVTPEKSHDGSDFLAELEHREELLRAGFMSETKRKRRRPLEEPTITLNKDEYDVKN